LEVLIMVLRNTIILVLGALAFTLVGAGVAQAQPAYVSYQGELASGGAPFNGPAGFKFVITDAAGTTTLWSHDGTSSGGAEPTGSLTLDVTDGLFGVLLGRAPMVPLTADALAAGDQARLRIWVDDTGSGFEQLPDQRLASAPFALRSDSAERAFGDFTAGGVVESLSGGFRFPDGTLQNTAAAEAPADIRIEIVSAEGLADAGDTDNAFLVLAVTSGEGPVTGLTLSDFSVTTYIVPAGGAAVTTTQVSSSLPGSYLLRVVPAASNWRQGRYLIAVRANTDDGSGTGVVALDIDP
jgi:hypothetical protein